MIENRILLGNSLDILKTLPEQSVDCCVTSPPYYLMRDYGGIDGQIGLEDSPEEYIEKLAAVFKEVKRVLKDSGTLWVIIGDSYAGSRKGAQGKHLYGYRNKEVPKKIYLNENMITKTLIGIPWRFAMAMQEDWLLRQDIIWAKPNPMPEPYKVYEWRDKKYDYLTVKIYLDNSMFYYCYGWQYKHNGHGSGLWIGNSGYPSLKEAKQKAMGEIIKINRSLAEIAKGLLLSELRQKELFDY
jgi:DNA modification methylase